MPLTEHSCLYITEFFFISLTAVHIQGNFDPRTFMQLMEENLITYASHGFIENVAHISLLGVA